MVITYLYYSYQTHQETQYFFSGTLGIEFSFYKVLPFIRQSNWNFINFSIRYFIIMNLPYCGQNRPKYSTIFKVLIIISIFYLEYLLEQVFQVSYYDLFITKTLDQICFGNNSFFHIFSQIVHVHIKSSNFLQPQV